MCINSEILGLRSSKCFKLIFGNILIYKCCYRDTFDGGGYGAKPLFLGNFVNF